MKKPILLYLTLLPFATIGQSFELVKTYLGHTSGVETVTFSPDGKNIISGDLDGNLFFWDVELGSIIKIIKAHKASVSQITFSTDGTKMCTASEDETVKVWNLKKAELLTSISSPDKEYTTNQVTIGIISPDGRYIYFGNTAGRIYKVDIEGNQTPLLVFKDKFFITDALLSFDKRYLIFSSGFSIKYLNFRTDKIDKEIGTCDKFVNNLALSPSDSNIIVSWCENGTMNFWNISKNMNISSIKSGDEEHYSKISFSSDGKYLISGNSKTNARVWDPITKNLLYELKGHTDVVRDLKFSFNNKFIVTSSYDGTLKLWKTPFVEQMKVVEQSKIKNVDNVFKPEVRFVMNNIPVSVSDRAVSKQEDLMVKNQVIEFFVWDNEEEDGDTISLNFNGTWVLEGYEVSNIKKSIKVTLQPNTNNYLILYAHNLGKKPPNTAAVSIYDGDKEKTLTLKSDLKNCGAINFYYKAK